MSVIEAILAVFTAIGSWFGTVFTNLEPIFWTVTETGGELTIIGGLSVAGLGVGVILLIFNKIVDIFRFH